MKKTRFILAATAVGIALLTAGFFLYANDYYRADEAAAAAMSSSAVAVEQNDDYLAFHPENAAIGMIFYPGGKVEHTAYAPLMRALAEQDVLCILVEMPFRLAVLDRNAADGIPEQYPQIERWYIGGHSLGGSMAASYVAEHADNYDGLVLLAAYSTADLRKTDLQVISIYGSEDGVMNREKYNNYRSNLPDTLVEAVIEGGCHAGFGSYGAQDGDGTPSISTEVQIAETVRLLTEFIRP